jgi:acetolactate synthase-1/2/3 large subunit
MPTHAEVLAATLAGCSVQLAFGLPGGEIVAFIDACRRAGIRFLLTGHECSAAVMAQVAGQITGVPGLCVATLGPGATNLITGVANAYLDRAPLLAVTAQMPASALATMSHQRLALDRLFSPITKCSATVAGDTAAVAAEAVRLASTPRPGPVHLSLPSDLAIRDCADPVTAANGTAPPAPGGRTFLTGIAARINACTRPLVLVGLGAEPSAAVPLRALVARLQAPFLVTPKVKGILPEDDPLFLGVASGMAIDRDIVETLFSADLVIAIGFDPVESDKTWFADMDVVSLDSASMSGGAYRPLEAIGDIGALTAELAGLVDPKPWPDEFLAARRNAISRVPYDCAGGLSPLRALEEMRLLLPRDGIVTCDVGSHKLLMGQFWRSYAPGTFFMSNGLSGMGFGVPAAIGASLSCPGRPTLAVVGDGGMLMTMHDLVLLRELNLPVTIVVFSDESLSLIRVSQSRKGLDPYGVDFVPPDFAAAARAFGIAAWRAGDAAGLRAACEQALESRRPALIDAQVDYREYYELV